MSLRLMTRIAFSLSTIAPLFACSDNNAGGGGATPGDAEAAPDSDASSPPIGTGVDINGRSPAFCGSGDNPEPNIQGDFPAGQTPNYNCGISLVGMLPRTGSGQGYGHCAYVRTGNSGGMIYVINVSDPANPVEMGTVQAYGGSESMRVSAKDTRAVLVSGRGVYDIRDCEHPVFKGEIKWPALQVGGMTIPVGLLPHDIRVNHGGTKVYASFGTWEADITNLEDSSTWRIHDQTCDVGKQFWPAQMEAADAGQDLCAGHDTAQSVLWASTPAEAVQLWPTMGHGPDTNGDDTRLYTAPVGGGASERAALPVLSIIDLTTSPVRLLDQILATGYGIDWFQLANRRQFVLRNPEFGLASEVNVPGDTCVPENERPERLGWAYSAMLTDVTNDKARTVSVLEMAINKPKYCEQRRASGHNPVVGYHTVDDPYNAKIAILDYGDAGLRVFDVRDPETPREVAYFNHGSLNSPNAGPPYYDASRGLIYLASGNGFWVLQLEPQVLSALGR